MYEDRLSLHLSVCLSTLIKSWLDHVALLGVSDQKQLYHTQHFGCRAFFRCGDFASLPPVSVHLFVCTCLVGSAGTPGTDKASFAGDGVL